MIDYFTTGGYINEVEKKSQLLKKDGKYFVEVIARNTFKDALSVNKNIVLLHEHNANEVLARVSDKTLNAYENSIGLKFTAQIPKKHNQLYMDIKNKKYGCSFGMRVLEDEWVAIRDKKMLEEIRIKNELENLPSNLIYLRTIKKIQLFEVTLTKNPAYRYASNVEVRNMANKDLEFRFINVDIEQSNDDWKWQLDLKRKRLNLL